MTTEAKMVGHIVEPNASAELLQSISGTTTKLGEDAFIEALT